MRDSVQNSSRHFLNFICLSFASACSFDLLLLFPDVWILLHFKRLYSYLYVAIFSLFFWHLNIYLVTSPFSFGPMSLVMINKASVCFFCGVYVSALGITLSMHTRSLCVPFNINKCCFSWKFVMVYSKAMLRKNVNKASRVSGNSEL
jgi:hypothetical protein